MNGECSDIISIYPDDNSLNPQSNITFSKLGSIVSPSYQSVEYVQDKYSYFRVFFIVHDEIMFAPHTPVSV